jgi:hypothetical protein
MRRASRSHSALSERRATNRWPGGRTASTVPATPSGPVEKISQREIKARLYASISVMVEAKRWVGLLQ